MNPRERSFHVRFRARVARLRRGAGILFRRFLRFLAGAQQNGEQDQPTHGCVIARRVVECAAMAAQDPPESPESTLDRIMGERRAKAAALRAAGSDPYRNDMGPTTSIAQVRTRYEPTKPPAPPPAPKLPKGEKPPPEPIKPID